MSDSSGPRGIQLAAILDVARSAVSAFDIHGKLIHTNLSERQLFARSEDDCVLGQSVHDYLSHNSWFTTLNEPISPDEMPIMRALRGEEVFDERLRVERTPGDFRYIIQNARPLMIEGEFRGAAMLSLDLTNLSETPESSYTHHLENAVRRSRMITEIVMEINDSAVKLDLDRMTSFAIERIAREFKANSGVLWLLEGNNRLVAHALHNASYDDFAAEGYHVNEFEFAREAMDRNQPMVVESEDLSAPEAIINCTGEAKSLLVIPLRIRGDRIGLAYLCIGDRFMLSQSDRLFASVWGRQCAQGIETAMLFEQIETANERLVSVIDQMPQAVMLIDASQEKVRIANALAGDLFSKEITDGTPLQDLPMHDVEGEALRGSQHPLLRGIRNGERFTAEAFLLPQQDGTVREVVVSLVPMRDVRGQIYGGITVLQDRADFASMDVARDEFISVIGHELRNPLTSLRGNLQLLERRVKRREQDEQSEDDLRRISIAINESDRIGDLITRMLDLSRAGLGRLDIQPEPMDAAQLVRDVAEAAQARDLERTVLCTVPDSVPVEWDSDRMYQVLGNLTQNADRYAPGTPLELRLEKGDPGQVRISVRDHGPGVPAKIRRRLFRQYYRFDDGGDSLSTLTDASRGLGIGLYITSRLVKQHGGKLRVQDAAGGGAEFILTMPVIAPPTVQRTPTPLTAR
jgi:signal transduction histidine kinase